MDDSRELRTVVGEIGKLWSRNWSLQRTDSYVRVLRKWPMDVIEEAIMQVARASGWRSLEAPSVSMFADQCRSIMNTRVLESNARKMYDI
jgi:hypothetical protein